MCIMPFDFKMFKYILHSLLAIWYCICLPCQNTKLKCIVVHCIMIKIFAKNFGSMAHLVAFWQK